MTNHVGATGYATLVECMAKRTIVPADRTRGTQSPVEGCSGERRVTTGHKGDGGRSLFSRFLAATATHRYAFCLTPSRRNDLHFRNCSRRRISGSRAQEGTVTPLQNAATGDVAASPESSRECDARPLVRPERLENLPLAAVAASSENALRRVASQ